MENKNKEGKDYETKECIEKSGYTSNMCINGN